MTEKKILRIMSKSSIHFILILRLLNLYRFFSQRRYLSDKKNLEIRFKKSQGYNLDLKNPKTLNEKMQWLKLYDRTELHTICADKLLAREFYERQFGAKYLIPLWFKTNNWKDITPDNMPDFPFIVKPNHASGWYKIVHNKNDVNWIDLQTECRFWLSQNYYKYQREWQYKNIPRFIIVERLLINDKGVIPTNFRVHCIHGRVELIALTIYLGNNTDDYRNLKFNRDWEYLDFDWADRKTDLAKLRHTEDYPKPENLDRIIQIAEECSRYFKYVRVDFYENEGVLYHGELTFHDGGGFEKITPFEWDLKLGSMINLNKDTESSILNA